MRKKQPSSNESNAMRIVVVLIIVVGTLLVGYWRFLYKGHKTGGPHAFTGRVIDHQNEKPIRNAKVVFERDQKVPQIQSTDSEGVFTVLLHESSQINRIRVEADGYEPFDRNVALSRSGIELVRLIAVKPTQQIQVAPSTLGSLNSSRQRQSKSNEYRTRRDLAIKRLLQ
jgi:hypothetical protein